MEFLNIKVINGDRNKYYGSVIKYSDGTVEGIGEEYNYHTLVTFRGIIINDELHMTILFNEMNNYCVDISTNLVANTNSYKESVVGKKYYYGETCDNQKDPVHIEITNVKIFVDELINIKKLSLHLLKKTQLRQKLY